MKNSTMKKLFVIALSMIMTLALAACGGSGSSDSEEGGKVAEIQEKGKIVMCTDAAWAPFEYIGADGEVTGVDVEIAKVIAEKLGVELEITNISFDTISTVLSNGEADMSLACITITDERKEQMDFSDPYTSVQQYMVVMADDNETTVMEALAGKAVGTHLGTTGDFLMSDEISTGVLANTGAENKQYKALPDAALAMKSGELTAIVCDSVLAENLVAANGDAFKCFPVKYADGTEAEVEQIGVAFNKGNDDLVEAVNEVLAELIESGQIDEFYVKHSEEASKL
mgnify:CR=1 FL=1